MAGDVLPLLDKDLEEVLDIPTKHKDTVMGFKKTELITREEEKKLKLKLLIKLIRYDNKRDREVL